MSMFGPAVLMHYLLTGRDFGALLRKRCIDAAAREADPAPTTGQIKAGVAKLGHITVSGVAISIENPEGSTRTDRAHEPPRWSVVMKQAHYGYVKGTEGNDGDHVDVFVKPGTEHDHDGPVYVIDQVDADGKFDEHKCMIGYASLDEARAAYAANYPKGHVVGMITRKTTDEFKAWLRDGDTTIPASTNTAAAKSLGTLLLAKRHDPFAQLTQRLLELIDELALERWTARKERLGKGDAEGHAFHGNQYTGGIGGGMADAELGPKPESVSTDKGIKEAVRKLFESGHTFTYEELKKATGNPLDVTLKTAISRLQNPKYAGDKGPLNIVKVGDGYRVEAKPAEPKPAEPTRATVKLPEFSENQPPAIYNSMEWRAAVKSEINAMAKSLGITPEQVKVTVKQKTFFVDGKKYQSAGTAFLGQNKIEVRSPNVRSLSALRATLSHEAEHLHFNKALNTFKSEYSAARNNGDIIDGKATGTGSTATTGYTLRPGTEEKYPAVASMGRYVNGEMAPTLMKEDGVTDYSKAYWGGWSKGRVSTESAIHETLAEMAAMRYGGKQGTEPSNTWRAFYTAVGHVAGHTITSRA